ncbi:hypothetical protein V6N13_082372 [Hibiscus sabdariffa]
MARVVTGTSGYAVHADSWGVLFVVVCWKLWYRRNCILVDADFVDRDDIVASSVRYVQELTAARPHPVLKEWSAGQMQPQATGWTLPRRGWVRLNGDGAVRLSDGAAAVGGVLRSDSGVWLFGFVCSLGKCSILNAELWAIYLGLMYAWNRGYRKVEVQSDSRDAIHCITKVDARRGGSALVIVVQELLRKDWEVYLSYVPHDFNTVADKLASLMCGQPVGEVVFEELPDLVSVVVIMKALSGQNLREDLGG